LKQVQQSQKNTQILQHGDNYNPFLLHQIIQPNKRIQMFYRILCTQDYGEYAKKWNIVQTT